MTDSPAAEPDASDPTKTDQAETAGSANQGETPGPGDLPDTYDVDAGDDVYRCPHCDRPFAVEHLRALHVGNTHAEAMSESDLAVYDAALEDESDALFVFHLKIVAAITALLFAFIYTYAFVWAG